MPNCLRASRHYNQTLKALSPAAASGDVNSLAVIDQLIQQQSAMIAYIDDFKLMMIVTLLAMPLALLLRKPRAMAGGGAPAAAHLDYCGPAFTKLYANVLASLSIPCCRKCPFCKERRER
jgi:hypothetical protein